MEEIKKKRQRKRNKKFKTSCVWTVGGTHLPFIWIKSFWGRLLSSSSSSLWKKRTNHIRSTVRGLRRVLESRSGSLGHVNMSEELALLNWSWRSSAHHKPSWRHVHGSFKISQIKVYIFLKLLSRFFSVPLHKPSACYTTFTLFFFLLRHNSVWKLATFHDQKLDDVVKTKSEILQHKSYFFVVLWWKVTIFLQKLCFTPKKLIILHSGFHNKNLWFFRIFEHRFSMILYSKKLWFCKSRYLQQSIIEQHLILISVWFHNKKLQL